MQITKKLFGLFLVWAGTTLWVAVLIFISTKMPDHITQSQWIFWILFVAGGIVGVIIGSIGMIVVGVRLLFKSFR